MNNNIEEYLNSLPDDIISINVSNKNLKFLPDLSRFTNLQNLYCNCNKLTSLPKLNSTLKKLICFNNELTSLPEFNENLIFINCSFNELTYLPEFNEKLQRINCYDNKLTSLPDFNINLQIIICTNNQLTSLPKLNTNLKSLFCAYNNLTSLPLLNDYLHELHFTYNQITHIPTLNKNLKRIDCTDNPFLIIYPDFSIKTINIINKFREIYYISKYGMKIFLKILKNRMSKYKYELLEKSAIISLNPKKIFLLLENNQLSFEDNSFENIL